MSQKADRVLVTDRNLGIIGAENQKKLFNSCVAIAGTGGMGGHVAMILARAGVGEIRIADNQKFDATNINRQAGAKISTIKLNKAECTAKEIEAVLGKGYLKLKVFKQGICSESADRFVSGADIVCDEIEFFELKARIQLHKAARKGGVPVLNCNAVKFGGRMFLFVPGGMTIEEFLEVEENTEVTPNVIKRLLDRLAPGHDIPQKIVEEWILRDRKAPIFTPTPYVSAGILAQRVCLMLIGPEQFPEFEALPQMPAYAYWDFDRFKCGVKFGRWWH